MQKASLILTVLVAFALFSTGVVFAADKSDAVSGANTAVVDDIGVYTETSAGTNVAQGGNVTFLNLTGNASTIKWAGYFGQVTASLFLGSGTDKLFSFDAVPNDQIKSVFASTDSSFNFGSLTAATGANVDTTYGWTVTDGDSGTLVFNDGTKTIAQVGSVNVVNLSAYTSGGAANSSIYRAGVFKDDGSVTADAFNVMAYGVSVDVNEKDYRNTSTIDYELIVPINSSGVAGTQTYYFFLDIE